ncbi:MAG: phosphotransferase [Owenweeksia sp.]|nr:phosphotransferase [Owenweeksia sp.]
MDNLLSQNKVSNSDIDKIATTLADFHQSAMVVKPELNLDHLKEKFNDISQSVDWVEKQLGSKWADIINRAITYNEGFLENHESRLKERIKNSFTRDVHGDLHSKNIFILKEPVIFDCIEFNEELRQIDLLDELAFFCMDLEAHHYNDLSGHFLQVYRKKSEVFFQPEDHAIFTYYRCYRANVRAKVMIIKARQPGSEENERNALLHDFKLYLKLIDGYLKEALPPF